MTQTEEDRVTKDSTMQPRELEEVINVLFAEAL